MSVISMALHAYRTFCGFEPCGRPKQSRSPVRQTSLGFDANPPRVGPKVPSTSRYLRMRTVLIQASLLLDFAGTKSLGLEILLSKQGTNWVGSGWIPNEVEVRDHKDEGKARFLAVNIVGKRSEKHDSFDVVIPPISAVFAGGIL